MKHIKLYFLILDISNYSSAKFKFLFFKKDLTVFKANLNFWNIVFYLSSLSAKTYWFFSPQQTMEDAN